MCACVCVCVYVCAHVCVCVNVCVCVCVCVPTHVYVCICVCVGVCTHMLAFSRMEDSWIFVCVFYVQSVGMVALSQNGECRIWFSHRKRKRT